MKVFISSTLADLSEHRAAAKKALESLKDMYVEYVEPENIGTETRPPLEILLEQVADASMFILLLGWRFGYVPEGYEESIIQLEYETAVKQNLPILCYILDPDYPVPAKFIETSDQAAKLSRFKESIRRERVIKYFKSPEDLAQQLTVDLTHWSTRPFSLSAEDVIVRPHLQNELKRCREENSAYVANIHDLQVRLQRIVPADPIWSTRNFVIDDTLCFVAGSGFVMLIL